MANHGSLLRMMLSLALADLGYACIPSDFRIFNNVEGFHAEGYVIFSPDSPENCGNFVQRYGASSSPWPPPSPPYDIYGPRECSYPDVDYVSAKISRKFETIFCQAYINNNHTCNDNHYNQYCFLYIRGENDNETGKLNCKVERSIKY